MLNDEIEKKGVFVKKVSKFTPPVKVGDSALLLESIENSTITTTSGKIFDADEKSQDRMTRSIMVMDINLITSIDWKLADNNVVSVSIDEMKEALTLAATNQANLWFNKG